MLNLIEQFIDESKKKELDTESLEGLYNRLLLGDSVEDAIEEEMQRLLSEAEPEHPIMTSTYHWSRKKEYLPQKIATEVGTVYALPDKFKNVNLKSEPHEEEFENLDYQDQIEKGQWEAENVLERKGRVSKPIDLRNYPDLLMGDGKTAIGVDVAGTGEDTTVLIVRQGIHVVDVQAYPFADQMATTGYVVMAIKQWNPDYVSIDNTGGYGSAVVSRLLELELDVVTEIRAINFQGSPINDTLRPANVRAELFLNLQDVFRRGDITLPSNDEELAKEIVYLRYEPTSKGEFKMVEKKIIKKELGRSPDRGDALGLCFYDVERMIAYF